MASSISFSCTWWRTKLKALKIYENIIINTFIKNSSSQYQQEFLMEQIMLVDSTFEYLVFLLVANSIVGTNKPGTVISDQQFQT